MAKAQSSVFSGELITIVRLLRVLGGGEVVPYVFIFVSTEFLKEKATHCTV